MVTTVDESMILNGTKSRSLWSLLKSQWIYKNRNHIGRHQTRNTSQQAYTEKIPLEKAKLKDLLSLCETGLVSLTYHDFRF